jgi:hypothetical protein
LSFNYIFFYCKEEESNTPQKYVLKVKQNHLQITNVQTKQDFICLSACPDETGASRNMYLAEGLYKFSLENSLEPGDVLRIKKQNGTKLR